MIIGFYFLLTKVVLPQFGAYGATVLPYLMAIVITLAGITMLFGAVGLKISTSLGSTVVNGIFKAIGFVGRKLFQGIEWCFKKLSSLLPRVYRESRNGFSSLGLAPWLSKTLATVITLLVIVIII